MFDHTHPVPVMGLDIAMKCTGICILSGDRLMVDTMEPVVENWDDVDWAKLVISWKINLSGLIQDHEIKELVIEKPFFRGPYSMILTWLVCGAHEVAYAHNVERREYVVSSVRKTLLGKNKPAKEAKPELRALFESIGVDFQQPEGEYDESDAMAVTMHHLIKCGSLESMTPQGQRH